MPKLNVGIIGATGYTCAELIRLLLQHPDSTIKIVTANSKKGAMLTEVHPQFQGLFEARLSGMEEVTNESLDVVFLALPHGVSMDFVKQYEEAGFKIIDLSGDFRLSSPDVYKTWYKKDHNYDSGFNKAVFGLPELFRNRIAKASLVANPGCFPTSAILPLAPLLKEGFVDPNHIVIDSKTGVTGAGIKAKDSTHFPNVNDNFSAYGVTNHRHTIEIQEIINLYSGQESTVLFTPHLLPVDRGILSTAYTRPINDIDERSLTQLFNDYYANEPFVRMSGRLPSLKQVRGTNYIDIYHTYDNRTNTVITISVIDNLMKGAASQAVQNMNLMFDLDEKSGLNLTPLQP
jgi:N-acetyl-gamma-glutamyl-phosphate reductase